MERDETNYEYSKWQINYPGNRMELQDAGGKEPDFRGIPGFWGKRGKYPGTNSVRMWLIQHLTVHCPAVFRDSRILQETMDTLQLLLEGR